MGGGRALPVEGGRQTRQQAAADVQIADKNVFFKSEAPYDAPYVAHTQLLPLGGIGTCIGFMANTVRRVSRRWAAGTVGGSPR